MSQIIIKRNKYQYNNNIENVDYLNLNLIDIFRYRSRITDSG